MTQQVRRGTRADADAAVTVWRAANEARRGGRPVSAEHERRVRGYLTEPGAFFVVTDDDSASLTGMALAMQARDEDGAGPPVPGLCHVSMVFVRPDHWGRGNGRALVDALLGHALAAGYTRAQLWTHADNERALRLYKGMGFGASGRRKADDDGEEILHLERLLAAEGAP